MKKITTVYLEDHQKVALEEIATERGERVATIIREALEWYTAITPYLRGQLGELVDIYEELPPSAIIGRLISDDERRRNGRNTKESGIREIVQSTGRIEDVTQRTAERVEDIRALLMPRIEKLATIEAARAAGCDDVGGFDEEGVEL
ncbi:MAG TPA: hypothetical protein VLA24_09325 [Pseudomonadales bacterium]|nr:hypothetical protein [Pseudomonadales bacterium]